jgi:hypothetical protein
MKTPDGWACDFCGKWPEIYMLQQEVWQSFMPTNKGNPCFECVEVKLGRKLTLADFLPCPLNDPIYKGFIMAVEQAERIEDAANRSNP